jgi:hypothetical protein
MRESNAPATSEMPPAGFEDHMDVLIGSENSLL